MSSIYDIYDIEKEIEEISADNAGEISDDLYKEYMGKVFENNEKILKLVKYIKHLEYSNIDIENEIERLRSLKERNENRVQSISKYLTQYVYDRKGLDLNIFKLSTRESESVLIKESEFECDSSSPYVCVKTVIRPDKVSIKEALKKGEVVPGASIKKSINLIIK